MQHNRLRYTLNRFGIWCLDFVILVKYPGQMHVILLRCSDGVFPLGTD